MAPVRERVPKLFALRAIVGIDFRQPATLFLQVVIGYGPWLRLI